MTHLCLDLIIYVSWLTFPGGPWRLDLEFYWSIDLYWSFFEHQAFIGTRFAICQVFAFIPYQEYLHLEFELAHLQLLFGTSWRSRERRKFFCALIQVSSTYHQISIFLRLVQLLVSFEAYTKHHRGLGALWSLFLLSKLQFEFW